VNIPGKDMTHGTVGWFALASGTVGVTRGQTVRLSVVNVGAVKGAICYGLWQNPEPLALLEDAFILESGYGKECDLKAADVSNEHFDKSGRTQVRALVRSSVRAVRANLEIFDDQTGKTMVILPLQELDASL
jgi:hypothetical protein